MIFKVVNARANNAEAVLSGVLSGTTQDEQELLQIIEEEFKKIKTYNDRVTAKDKKLVFKGVPVGLLKQSLGHLAKALEFDLTYEIGKDFTGDAKIRTLIEKSLDV